MTTPLIWRVQRETGGPDPSITGRSQVAIGFLRNTDMYPIEKQLDIGSNVKVKTLTFCLYGLSTLVSDCLLTFNSIVKVKKNLKYIFRYKFIFGHWLSIMCRCKQKFLFAVMTLETNVNTNNTSYNVECKKSGVHVFAMGPLIDWPHSSSKLFITKQSKYEPRHVISNIVALYSILVRSFSFQINPNMSRDMLFPTLWHFDKCRLKRACAASC